MKCAEQKSNVPHSTGRLKKNRQISYLYVFVTQKIPYSMVKKGKLWQVRVEVIRGFKRRTSPQWSLGLLPVWVLVGKESYQYKRYQYVGAKRDISVLGPLGKVRGLQEGQDCIKSSVPTACVSNHRLRETFVFGLGNFSKPNGFQLH